MANNRMKNLFLSVKLSYFHFHIQNELGNNPYLCKTT